MPPARKPIRLHLRPASVDRQAVWLIKDGEKRIRTGCSEGDSEGAARALKAYIAKRFVSEKQERHRGAEEVPVAEVLAHYVAMKKESARRPKELASRISTLLDWWGDKTLDDVTRATCKAYADSRSTPSAARRELEDMRSAINMAIADNVCREAVKVTLPPKPKGRTQYLQRDQVASLIWAAYSRREIQQGKATAKRPMAHIARFILIALYTGSRSGRIWQASFVKEPGRPWIDLVAGVYYRAPDDEVVAANKRAPPIRIPPRLLAHMRRWHRMGARYAVEYHGKPSDPKKAFRKLTDEVLGEAAAGVVRHTLRHTSATWLMQGGVDIWEASGFLGMTREVLESTYGHHHPDHQSAVGDAFTRGTAGRKKK